MVTHYPVDSLELRGRGREELESKISGSPTGSVYQALTAGLISKGDSHESDLTPGYEIVTPNSQSGVMRKSRVVTATRLTV